MAKIHIAATLLALAVMRVTPGVADEAVIERWYNSLLAVDRPGLTALLAENARINLTDLGVEQTKAEFIASMDEWEGAVAGSTIRHRVEAMDGNTTTVVACYDFPANDILMRETFRIENGLIAENTQSTMAETCVSY